VVRAIGPRSSKRQGSSRISPSKIIIDRALRPHRDGPRNRPPVRPPVAVRKGQFSPSSISETRQSASRQPVAPRQDVWTPRTSMGVTRTAKKLAAWERRRPHCMQFGRRPQWLGAWPRAIVDRQSCRRSRPPGVRSPGRHRGDVMACGPDPIATHHGNQSLGCRCSTPPRPTARRRALKKFTAGRRKMKGEGVGPQDFESGSGIDFSQMTRHSRRRPVFGLHNRRGPPGGGV